MRTFKNIPHMELISRLTMAAQGIAAISGYKYVVSDIVIELNKILPRLSVAEPFYIAIREQGTEGGTMEECIERCQCLGYPIVIAKVESDKVCDFNLTMTFTKWHNSANLNCLKKEFKLL